MKYRNLLILLILSGCVNTNTDYKACKVTAPVIVQYSNASQDKAADEIQGGSCPMLANFASDYEVMRDQSRLLLKAR